MSDPRPAAGLAGACLLILALAAGGAGTVEGEVSEEEGVVSTAGTAPSVASPQNLHSLLAEPLETSEDIRVVPLARTEAVSLQLVRVREAVAAHYHAEHTETVLIVEGEGEFTIGDEVFAARPGDSFVIPAGTVHAFRVRGDGPAAAVTTFSPAFDGEDRIFLDRD